MRFVEQLWSNVLYLGRISLFARSYGHRRSTFANGLWHSWAIPSSSSRVAFHRFISTSDTQRAPQPHYHSRGLGVQNHKLFDHDVLSTHEIMVLVGFVRGDGSINRHARRYLLEIGCQSPSHEGFKWASKNATVSKPYEIVLCLQRE